MKLENRQEVIDQSSVNPVKPKLRYTLNVGPTLANQKTQRVLVFDWEVGGKPLSIWM